VGIVGMLYLAVGALSFWLIQQPDAVASKVATIYGYSTEEWRAECSNAFYWNAGCGVAAVAAAVGFARQRRWARRFWLLLCTVFVFIEIVAAVSETVRGYATVGEWLAIVPLVIVAAVSLVVLRRRQ